MLILFQNLHCYLPGSENLAKNLNHGSAHRGKKEAFFLSGLFVRNMVRVRNFALVDHFARAIAHGGKV